MKRIEALDAIMKFSRAYEEGSIQGMTEAVGLTEELMQHMSVEDIGDAIAVRLNDIMQTANPNGTPNP